MENKESLNYDIVDDASDFLEYQAKYRSKYFWTDETWRSLDESLEAFKPNVKVTPKRKGKAND